MLYNNFKTFILFLRNLKNYIDKLFVKIPGSNIRIQIVKTLGNFYLNRSYKYNISTTTSAKSIKNKNA